MKGAFALLAWMLAFAFSGPLAQGQTTSGVVVRGVLLYQPFCAECPTLLDEFLYPASDEYGSKLELMPVDVSEPRGAVLLANTVAEFGISQASSETPILVIGGKALVGSAAIVADFESLVDGALDQGGTAWPEIDGLQGLIQTVTTPPEPPRDRIGEALAWAVMIAMLGALAYLLWSLPKILPVLNGPKLEIRAFGIPVLALAGLAISAYLLYVKLSQAEAVCGPVGDCNLVQASQYASILGIPMAALGLVFYLGVCVLWLCHSASTGGTQRFTGRLLAVAVVIGTLFSIYLTGLELFVIHAVCAWCLTSAVLATVMMLLTVTAIKGKAVAAEG